MQTAAILTKTGSIQLELPDAGAKLLGDDFPGCRAVWGDVACFPTPAYWQFQVLARRLIGRPATYRLGRTLTEEVGACLLGGHGIPATVGLAAFERLREQGAFAGAPPSQDQLERWLREPLLIDGRGIRYRFASQKARYLAAALPLVQAAPKFTEGRPLRDWLLQLQGVGPKTASWIARNWLDCDDVAILDVHILRVGRAIDLFPRTITVERHYAELERLFVAFARAIDCRTSELDTVIWAELASSPASARFLDDYLAHAA